MTDSLKPSKERICAMQTSLAWIEPSGVVHWMTGATHRSWANVHLNAELDKDSYYADPVSELLIRGWLRVTSKSEIQMLHPDKLSQQAWDAWAEISSSCLGVFGYDVATGEKARYNPESQVLIDYGAGRFNTMQLSLADILQTYCSKSAQDKIWSSVMGESTVRRLIREMLLQEKTLADVTKLSGKWNLTPKERTSAGADLNYSDNKNVSGQRRELKSLWNQYADHSYFQDPSKLFVMHYLGYYSENKELADYFPRETTTPGSVPGIDFPSKDELSCFASPASFGGPGAVQLRMPFFTFKKYRLTFASFVDAATERLSYAVPAEIRRHKGSGLPKRPAAYLTLDQMPIDQEEVEENRGLEEVVIDNWVIDTFYCEESDVEYALDLGLKYEVL